MFKANTIAIDNSIYITIDDYTTFISVNANSFIGTTLRRAVNSNINITVNSSIAIGLVNASYATCASYSNIQLVNAHNGAIHGTVIEASCQAAAISYIQA